MAGDGNAGIMLRQHKDPLTAVAIAAVCVVPGAPPEEIPIACTAVRMLYFSLDLVGDQVRSSLFDPPGRNQLPSVPLSKV